MHKLAVIALDDMVLLDLTIPYETFRRATDRKGHHCYDVWIAGPKKSAHCSGVRLQTEKSLTSLRRAQTIVLPGMRDPESALPKEVAAEIHSAHARGARIITICSGAFLLAQTGLLDGKRATTHWMGATALKERHPMIEVDPNVLYIDSGQILTSAGAFAGMDLCLYVLRKDFGAAVASHAARIAVTPLERSGGQAQFIVHALPESNESLSGTIDWLKANLRKELTVETIAKRARMSVRTLNRQFQKQLGLSPQRWLIQARVLRARELLETSDRSIEEISVLAGFSSALSMREHFKSFVHSSPSTYRNQFKNPAIGSAQNRI